MEGRFATVGLCFVGLLLYCYGGSVNVKKFKQEHDYEDTLEDETYEQETTADIFYDDAVKHALQLLWEHRYQISMANHQLIEILGRNATETVKFRKELQSMKNLLDQKSENLKNKILKKLTLSDMAEPIESPIFEKLTHTWKNLKQLFDIHKPKNSTYEFTELYKWMVNSDNETSNNYKKVAWLMARIKKMRPTANQNEH